MLKAHLRGAALAAAIFALGTAAPAAAKDFTDAERAAIEKIVREYILEHPEIIPEAIEVLHERMATASVRENAEALFNDGYSHVAGNPRGDVTVVEFFDYTCPYCKLVNPSLKKLIESDRNVRVVFKEWPIRGGEAEFASRAAIASEAQGKYMAFHDALMAHRGALNEKTVFEIAARVGLDVERLKQDMRAPKVQEVIDRNRELGAALNLRGTPAFIIGDKLVPGAIEYDEMARQVAEARKK